jgi:peptide-methionine (S)-S-oxide reductase
MSRYVRALLGAAAMALGLTTSALAQSRTAPGGRPLATATFAAGCFWCAEADFEKVPGVVDAVSGYTGGRAPDPTYEQVSAGGTGHLEAVRVHYDAARVSYAQLLDVFWRNVDPFDAGGQFCDKGEQYTAAVFVATPEERALAEASKRREAGRLASAGPASAGPASAGRPIATRVLAAAPFYEAEAYHQAYAKKNPVRYRFYRTSCRRDARLRELRELRGGGEHGA